MASSTMPKDDERARHDLAAYLFAEATAIAEREVSERGQGDLLRAMRTVTAPAIQRLMAAGHYNGAARWLVRADGAVVWRSYRRVRGTQELAKTVCEHYLDCGFTARARFLWKSLMMARRSAIVAGLRQIRQFEKHYPGNRRLPKDVGEFLGQCRELLGDVQKALAAGGRELIVLCDRFGWQSEREDAERLLKDPEPVTPARRRLPRGVRKSDDSFQRILHEARQRATAAEFTADALAELLVTMPVGEIVRFKKVLLENVRRLLPIVSKAAPGVAGASEDRDGFEDLAVTIVACSPESSGRKRRLTKREIDRALAANELAKGGIAATCDAPDLAYQTVSGTVGYLFERIRYDPIAAGDVVCADGNPGDDERIGRH